MDSPKPVTDGVFGRGMASGGDLNGDGEDDLLLSQQGSSPNSDGQVFLISGETGALIDTILAPDNGNPTNAAGNNRAGFGSFQDRLELRYARLVHGSRELSRRHLWGSLPESDGRRALTASRRSWWAREGSTREDSRTRDGSTSTTEPPAPS